MFFHVTKCEGPDAPSECSSECDSTTPPPFITAATTVAQLCDCENPETPDSIKTGVCGCPETQNGLDEDSEPEPEPEVTDEPEAEESGEPEVSGSGDDCDGDDCQRFQILNLKGILTSV